MDFGMRKLIELFYAAVKDEGPDPLPADQILRTSRIMEIDLRPDAEPPRLRDPLR